MEYQSKVSAVEALNGKFKKAPFAILADYRGLTVAEITDLRREVAAVDGELIVAKNTLAKLALYLGQRGFQRLFLIRHIHSPLYRSWL